MSFQNLGRATEKVAEYFGVDLKEGIGPDAWHLTERAFLKRHVIAHRSGVIDEQYRQTSGDMAAMVGRRITATPQEVGAVAEALELIGAGMLRDLPAP